MADAVSKADGALGCPAPLAQEALKLAEDAVRRFYQKDYDLFLDHLEDDCVFLGVGDFLFASRKDLGDWIATTGVVPVFSVRDAEFRIAGGDEHQVVVFGRFNLFSGAEAPMIAAMRQRMTACLRRRDGRWMAYHIHVSNEWSELLGDDLFPVRVSTQTYEYVQRIIRAGNALARRDLRVDLGTGGVSFIVDPGRLLYVKAAGRTCVLHLDTGESAVDLSIGAVAQKLPEYFLRIHRSYLVNCGAVQSIEPYHVTLVNGERLPVPARRYSEIRRDVSMMLTGTSAA